MADFETGYPSFLASDAASWFTNDCTWLFQGLASHPSVSFAVEDCIPAVEEVRPNTPAAAAVVSSFTIIPDVSEMRQVFEKFDHNNDGLICSQDLRCFMDRLGYHLTQEEGQLMLESVDGNQDGRVNFDEFLSLYRSLCDGETPTSSSRSTSPPTASTSISNLDVEVEKGCLYEEDSTLLEAFRVFDKNQDGVITAEELQSVLLDLGMPEGRSLRSCEQMIETVDADGNGVIDITEFKQMMTTSFAFC